MSDRRLPLPGERPISIWRPRTRRAWPLRLDGRSSVLRGLVAAVALAVATLVAREIWQLTGTPVTVIVNGEPRAFSTHRHTVGGAVWAAGIDPEKAVYLYPSAETPLTAGMVITAASLRPVLIHTDAGTFIAAAHSPDPRAIITELGLALGPQDGVRVERALRPSPAEAAADPALAAAPAIPREVRIVHPTTVVVEEDEQRVAFPSTAATLGEALAAAGYALYEADRLSLPLDTPLAGNAQLEVKLERAVPVTVLADGRTHLVRTHQQTVGALLAELGLALGDSDYTLPDPSSPLPAGGMVRLVRVREEVLVEEIPIPFETVYVPDPDLELDQQRLIQEGEEGLLERRVRVRYEDGVAVSHAAEGEWVARQPRARVIGYGTRFVIRTLRTRFGDFQYWRKLRVLATSYSPSTAGYKPPDDPYLGLAATGVPVQRGVIAVDPRVIPLYTYLYVPGYGPGRALDIGGAVKGYRIDLGYTDEDLVLWNKWVDVYLLMPPPPPEEMIWVLP